MITEKEFLKGVSLYEKFNKRDAMYKVAAFNVANFWGNVAEMANGLGVILLTWNHPFYRFGEFDFDKLEKCLKKNFEIIDSFRSRKISDLHETDYKNITTLFICMYEALAIAEGKKKGVKSYVSVSKALHLLAPDFFPLVDNKIASAYKINFSFDHDKNYIKFCEMIKTQIEIIAKYTKRTDKTLVRFLDEYNYVKFTKKWLD